MYPFGGNVSTSSGGSGSWICLWPPRSAGEQADFLISGSETYEYVTHISVFSEILAIELITCSVTKLTPRM